MSEIATKYFGHFAPATNEMRPAGKAHTVLRWLMRFFCFSILTLSLWFLTRQQNLFEIQSVHQFLSPPTQNSNANEMRVWSQSQTQIEKILRSYKGQSLWNVSLAEVEGRLKSIPFIKNLELQKVWPNTLEVRYSFPTLKALVHTRGSQYRVLTEDGHLIGPLRWSVLPQLPWIRGPWISQTPGATDMVLQFLRQLPNTGPLSLENLSEINLTKEDGLILTLAPSGQQIRFGRDHFEMKALRVSQVLDYLQNRNLESRVIDANFSKKVLVRLRNQP